MGAEPRRPGGLSRERIVGAARDIVTREGLPALSMRRLALELDVWPMSIYRHFRNKDELLDAMAATAADRIAIPSESESWRVQLGALLRAAHEALAGDESGIGSRLPSAFLSPSALRISEAGMHMLQTAGFGAPEAASAWRALWSYTFGFATFRFAATSEEARRRVRVAVAALPDDGYPTLLAMADELTSAWADEDEFDRGLELMLDSLQARLRSSASASSV